MYGQLDLKLDQQESLKQVADKLVASVQKLMRYAKTEEDLRIGFEKILEPLSKEINVELKSQYEKTILGGGRADALHGQVIIEYESPGAFASKKWINHAFDQLVRYIQGEAKPSAPTIFIFDPRLVGVGFDGEQVFFTQYRGNKNVAKTQLDPKDFVLIGPLPFTPESARTFLTYLRSLGRLPLTAEYLSARFGPKSTIAPLAVSALVDSLKNWASSRVGVFYDEWKRLFGIVYGVQFHSMQLQEAQNIAKMYNVEESIDFQEFLFSIHTYFALVMKLIAAEIITLKESGFSVSLSYRLTHSSKREMKTLLCDIEDGKIYSEHGVTNFLEGDFFRWYLDVLSPRLEEAIRETARALSEFEPATTIIDPESTRDLLKKLYQNLVPSAIRHKLGEYYTPDWLAELVIRETGYDGNPRKRLLDPACGSGTFVVLAIQYAREYAQKHRESQLETAKSIAANIWGFDLNPIAVIASRTNYLFAMGDLSYQLQNFEIPIYLADSVLWPEKAGQYQLNFAGGEHIKIQTSVGQFHVPYIWVKDEGLLMRDAAPLIEQMTKNEYSLKEAMKRFKAQGLVFPPHEKIVENFYGEILELQRQGKNGIWARFLKNAFAPMMVGQFDFVVGNPPWIRWGYLAPEYREATLAMWKDYGLFSLKGHAARLGGGEKDFSMLFTYVAADYYLKKNGILGFLITQEVFKSKGAGEGFRRFQLGDGETLKVLKAHDLVSVKPFEGAANKTAAIILKKGERTQYPIPYTLWKRRKKVGKIGMELNLIHALELLSKTKLKARPIGKPAGAWQTIEEKKGIRGYLLGQNQYLARLGARIEPYGVFLLKIERVLANNDLMVQNLPDLGKRDIPLVEERIEPDLVFPALRGSDILRWQAVPRVFMLMVQDTKKREPLPEATMKSQWPRTYGYLTKFKQILLTRGSKVVKEFAEKTEFYAMYGIGSYTVERYKVVWKRMASDIVAAVISQHKAPFGYRTIIPTDTTSIIATKTEEEAHFICAIINSLPVREFIKSFSSAGRGFAAPSVMSHVAIPKFDPKNELHQKLSQISKTLHEFKKQDDDFGVARLEAENDDLVKQLFGIK